MTRKPTSRTSKTVLRNSKAKALKAPQLPFELSQRHPYIGDERFEDHGGHSTNEQAKVTVLSSKLIEREAGKFEIPAHVPEGATRYFRPRALPKPEPRRLKRFSGRKMTALNDTFVFPPDERWSFFDSSYPWRCIGRISWTDPADNSFHWGSATLVGRSYVVTAAHVLPLSNNTLLHPVTFTPAFNGSGSLLGAGFTASVVQAAYWEQVNDDVCGYDMAICRLSRPFGENLGYFGSKGYDDDWEDRGYWDVVGYPYDFSGGSVPTFQSGVAVVDDDGDSHGTLELETYADVASGNSGGPLFAFWDDLPYVIGICSGNETEFSYSFPLSFTENHNVFAGGGGLNRLIRWGRENWG